MACMSVMEGQLYRCGKGKGREVEEEVSPILGSPLVLDCSLEEGNTSDDSYHTPPFASLSVPPQSSPINKSDKENSPAFGIGYDPRTVLVPIGDAPPENTIPIPICEPTLNLSGLERFIVVHGQQAICSLGRPKSSFHPYLCPIGVRSSTHRQSSACCSYQGVDREMSSMGSDA